MVIVVMVTVLLVVVEDCGGNSGNGDSVIGRVGGLWW